MATVAVEERTDDKMKEQKKQRQGGGENTVDRRVQKASERRLTCGSAGLCAEWQSAVVR